MGRMKSIALGKVDASSRPRIAWTVRAAISLHRRMGILFNRMEAQAFDLRHGTDTTGKIPVSEIEEVVGENVTHGTGYQAVNERHFRHVMEALTFPDGSVFVDIGCGKGKPLLLAATYSVIASAIGIEFGGTLCAVARRNAVRYGEKRKIANKISVLHQDALQYDIEPDQNIFFMNNPFHAEVLSVFVEKIHASARERPRPVWLLYNNPCYAAAVDAHPGFERVALFRFFGPGRNIAVYRSFPKAA